MIVVAACFRSETKAVRPRPGLRLVRTTMGGQAAADVGRAVVEPPALLLSTGFCGGAAADLRLGDLVLADEIRSRGEVVRVDRALVERACGLLTRGGLAPRVGPEECASQMVSAAEKRALAATGVLGVDLESAVVARWAEIHAVPFLSLRVVLDTADEDLPFSGRTPLWLSVLRHPIAAARVGRAAGEAATRLGAAVNCIAKAWEAAR